VTRTTTTRLIAEQLPNLNSRKRLTLEPKLDPERSLWPSFSKKLMHLKDNWNLKRLQAVKRETRKAESILSSEINLINSSDEGGEYLFTSSQPFRSSKTKLAKSSHPTIMSLIVNHEEHLFRALADTGASSIILEEYTSSPFIKTNDSNISAWSTMDEW
jgi:hypothetical protein